MRRSKLEPCSQHSIWQSSTSPSESETFACEQMSLTANTSPSVRTRATGTPSSSTRLGVSSSSSLSAAGAYEAFDAHATDASSSARSCAISRSSTSGTPICWTSSAKKPRTTSRRASSSGMPRAIR